MKIRAGFVSNSSSSSFVAVGYAVTKDYNLLIDYIKDYDPDKWDQYCSTASDEKLKELESENDYDKLSFINGYLYHVYGRRGLTVLDEYEDGYYDEGTFFIGHILAEWDEEEDQKISFNKITEIMENLKKNINHFPKHDAKVIMGTRMT